MFYNPQNPLCSSTRNQVMDKCQVPGVSGKASMAIVGAYDDAERTRTEVLSGRTFVASRMIQFAKSMDDGMPAGIEVNTLVGRLEALKVSENEYNAAAAYFFKLCRLFDINPNA